MLTEGFRIVNTEPLTPTDTDRICFLNIIFIIKAYLPCWLETFTRLRQQLPCICQVAGAFFNFLRVKRNFVYDCKAKVVSNLTFKL